MTHDPQPGVQHRPTPAGSWPSPLTARDLDAGCVSRAEPRHRAGRAYWAEGRPDEGGRTVIVTCDLAGGELTDLGPPEFNTRTLVHEYGGGAWLPTEGGVLGARFDDQRLWLTPDDGATPEPISPEPAEPRALRYADPADAGDGSTIWVHERHRADTVDNLLVAIGSDGGVTEIATGHDFYAAPSVSPDGTRLAFLAWDHPDMPWDHTLLYVCAREGATWGPPRPVLDGPALQQPRWSPDGELHVVSDATGWWNLHRVDLERGTSEPILVMEAEFGVPSWVFANRTYDWSPDGSIWCTWIDRGVAHLGRLVDGSLHEVDAGFTEFGRLEALPDGSLLTLAASWTRPAAVVVITVEGDHRQLSRVEPPTLANEDVSTPELVEFPDSEGRACHAFFFPPRNSGCEIPEGELPPLVVLGHGGPTGNARSSFDQGIQYWTSRGIAVVDVNYGGSTGFGTEYRNRLRGRWGVTDTADCTGAAEYLAATGRVDPARLAIKGGSAGGYTTLCALVFGNTFAAGMSRYGVADLETLARDTHKFEARYLDSLVGPWPEDEAIYRARSPIHHTDRLATPMIVLQGADDPVVPPSQSEQLVDALATAGVPHAYVLFDGESHGFRKAENIAAALEAELSFLGQVLGFTPAGDIEPVELRR